MTQLPEFSGEKLALARQFRCWTQAHVGDQVAVAASYISRLEANRRRPDEDVVEALADVLGFRRDFFSTPIEDPFFDDQCFFRRRARTSVRRRRQVMARGTLLVMLVAYLRRHVSLPELDLPSVESDGSRESIERAAERCRRHWELGAGPLLTLGRLIENAGLILMRLDAETDDVDAFSRRGSVSVVVLNTVRGSASRSRFDMGHELAHFLLHDSSVLNATRDIEAEANQFSSSFLLPRSSFGRDFASIGRLDWPHLFELKRKWQVSVQAILFRGRELGLIGPAIYRRLWKQLAIKGWRTAEPHEPEHEKPELLRIALSRISQKTGKTTADIAVDLGWEPETLAAVADVVVEIPSADVIPLRAAER